MLTAGRLFIEAGKGSPVLLCFINIISVTQKPVIWTHIIFLVAVPPVVQGAEKLLEFHEGKRMALTAVSIYVDGEYRSDLME